MIAMSSRTTRLAAAGLLVVVLPLSGAAAASAQSRAEARSLTRVASSSTDSSLLLDAVGAEPRRRSTGTVRPDATDPVRPPTFVVRTANLTTPDDDAARQALQTDIQEAVDSAHVAVARARTALARVATAHDAVARRFAATELADAETGLAASVAHLRYTVDLVANAGSPDAAEALRTLTDGVAALHRTVLDVNV